MVLIPGVTGSKLRDRETGRVAWGNAKSFFFPRDGGYSLARPVDLDVSEEDRLEAFAPILRVRLFGIFKFDIYSSLVRLMESNGYRLGDLKAPRPDDTFFFFPYDWRRGNIEAAAELARRLENLRKIRGEDVLRVDFICQSNAARLARYFLKYGAASLEEAEAGSASRPSTIRVGKMIMVGTANGGALGILEEMNRGRSYSAVIGRKLRPETLFTIRSLFEALPSYRDDLFFDAEGRPVEVDLYDPESWEHYGWSVYAPKVAKRLEKGRRAERYGNEKQRTAYLAEALNRARRLHHLLMQDVEGFGRTRYYSIQNVYEPTLERALLIQQDGVWRTELDLKKIAKRDGYLSTLAAAPGDKHATLDSQNWLSPQELAAVVRPPVFVPAGHRKIVLHPAAHRWILEFLLE